MNIKELELKAHWVREETLKLHRLAPGTRLASSLSCVEIFVALYYGGGLKYGPMTDEERDRLFVSKGHGSICLYPILADCGFFPLGELENICLPGSFLGTIPDVGIPGYESINGSLGLGPGVACGTALALKKKQSSRKVFVMTGDGEMNEGGVWEAIMFAGFHHLDNIVLIIDNNKISMLDYQKNIMGLDPITKKLEVFGWKTFEVDGHDLNAIMDILKQAKDDVDGKPIAIVADTIKGKGVKELENDILCHVRSLSAATIDKLLAEGEF